MHWSLDIALRILLTLTVIITLSRLHGLRTFSKMSSFDFAITVSIGSLLASAITTLDTGIHVYLGALAVLIVLQMVMAQARARLRGVQPVLDNTPLLVFENGAPLPENLHRAGMTRADLLSKLREANALDLRNVHAVVIETTGDVSVLHGEVAGGAPDAALLEGVRR